ncbi:MULTISPECIES: hypothetical protein [unclassified Sporosarcina]|uniref:hypothetical protein n=1 Tax=unclassified Sporosarcina TaxID=2647733 RepID=UPI000C162894|nr:MULTISPECIES: hypothetical protein [unclassified Sporosarcina]PID05546.1 hypothetical protein CSV66_09055 [Sporosarcina sp. P30]PID08740.1 hypothetical protein CSV65_09055 [Sporosarcina sp. P31]PID11912.1 hypothetical protein CSV64_09165 [Sporosarcina sp. P32b]
MNKVKKSLDAAAGDVFNDKEELKQRVLYGGRKPKRRNPFPIVASAIVLVAIVLITFNILQNGSTSTNGSTYKTDETLYDLMLQSERLDQGDSDELRYRVFQSILEIDSVIDYAASQGYKEDREEIDTIINEQQQSFFNDFTEVQLKSVEKAQMDNFGYSYDQYFKVILTYTQRHTNVMNWLQRNKPNDETTQRQILDAFQKEHQQVITAFMEKKSIPDLMEKFRTQTLDGVVASADQGQVLLVLGLEPKDYEGLSTDEIIDLAYESAWFNFSESFDDIQPDMHIEVTFDPLSYAITQRERPTRFHDIIKWNEYEK